MSWMTRLGRSLGLALSSLCVVGLSACGSDGDGSGGEAGEACQQPGFDYEVTAAEQEHTCLHFSNGPYGELSNQSNIDNLHMHYTVTLTGEVTTLSILALETTPHLFYFDKDVPRKYFDAAGNELCIANQVEPTSCSDAAVVDVVDLVNGETATVEMGPSAESELVLIAERK